jgi:hypothetical protein
MVLYRYEQTGCLSQVLSIHALCFGHVRFALETAYREFFHGFPWTHQADVKLGHDCLIPHPLWFISH